MDHRPNLLIVGDEESQRSPDSKELKEESHDSDRGRNGKEAIQILNTLKPDLIMLDIVIPVMKSMETLGRIIGQHKDVHLLLYSSYPHYSKDFMSWVADAYLTKFSDLTDLKKTIKNLLGR